MIVTGINPIFCWVIRIARYRSIWILWRRLEVQLWYDESLYFCLLVILSFVLVQDSSHPFSPIPITTHPVKYVSSNESEIVSKKVYDLVLFTTEDGLTDKKMRKMTLFRDMSVLYYEHFSFRSLLFTTTPQLHDFFQNTSVIVVDDFKWYWISLVSD